MNFYIASTLSNSDNVKQLASELKLLGWKQTYDWTAHGSVQELGHEIMSNVSEREIEGVMNADVLIVLTPGGRGTHIELGVALGANECLKNLSNSFRYTPKPIKIFLIASVKDFLLKGQECSFYYNSEVQRIIKSKNTCPSKLATLIFDYCK